MTTNTAVIAVHLQNDVVHADGAFSAFFAQSAAARGVVEKAARITSAARSAGTPVIFTVVGWDEGHRTLVANTPLLQIVAQQKCLTNGTWQTQVLDELSPAQDDIIIVNERVSSLEASPLDQILRARGVDTLIIFGVATNVSVESTARHAADIGYSVIVVEDASSTTGDDAHNASIASLGLFAVIADTEAVLDRLRTG
jgi:nicotinamidase-related amidase